MLSGKKRKQNKANLKTPQIATTLALLINCFNKPAFLEKEERYSVIQEGKQTFQKQGLGSGAGGETQERANLDFAELCTV